MRPLKYLYFKLWNFRFRFLYQVARRNQQLQDELGQYTLALFSEMDKGCTGVHTFLAPLPGYARESGFDACIEAPVVVVVHINGTPALGMSVEFFRNTLSIRQLQGQKGFACPESLKNWPKLFVEACMGAAIECGIKRLRLYRADQDLFYKEPHFSDPAEASPEAIESIRRRMRRRYDGTARQMGFVMHERWGELINPTLSALS
jgi:hypothetical protein